MANMHAAGAFVPSKAVQTVQTSRTGVSERPPESPLPAVAERPANPTQKSRRHPTRQRRSATALVLLLVLMQASCTHYAARKLKVDAKLIEAARVNNQAARDALHLQPTDRRDEHTATALEFAAQNERVLGSPAIPLPIEPILAEKQANPPGASGLRQGPEQQGVSELFQSQNGLVREQRRLEDRLITMGEVHEVRRNSKISFWTRLISFLAGPFGLLIVLLVAFPAAAPILGRLLAWLVGKLPALAGYIGVVGTQAFDATVRGIERFKSNSGLDAGPGTPKPPVSGPAAGGNGTDRFVENQGAADGVPPVEQLAAALSRSMDGEHKALVRERKRKL